MSKKTLKTLQIELIAILDGVRDRAKEDIKTFKEKVRNDEICSAMIWNGEEALKGHLLLNKTDALNDDLQVAEIDLNEIQNSIEILETYGEDFFEREGFRHNSTSIMSNIENLAEGAVYARLKRPLRKMKKYIKQYEEENM